MASLVSPLTPLGGLVVTTSEVEDFGGGKLHVIVLLPNLTCHGPWVPSIIQALSPKLPLLSSLSTGSQGSPHTGTKNATHGLPSDVFLRSWHLIATHRVAVGSCTVLILVPSNDHAIYQSLCFVCFTLDLIFIDTHFLYRLISWDVAVAPARM